MAIKQLSQDMNQLQTWPSMPLPTWMHGPDGLHRVADDAPQPSGCLFHSTAILSILVIPHLPGEGC